MSSEKNNKRIMKNTILLYFRTFLTMGVTLYTSRVILRVLGIENFGIYNIVGSVVVLFSFLNTAMSSATQRFLNFALGVGDMTEVKRVFSMSMTVHISIALLVIVLAETIGLWFVNTQLNIPAERMIVVNWVYQFSILTFCTQIIRVPYNASIIAYEKMSFYAYISIAEVVLKLLIVFLLLYFGEDKLKLYAILTCVVTLVILIFYKLYCNIVFKTCRYNFFWNASLYKRLLCFSGWSLFGTVAHMGAQQGLNILLNIFYGITINAAMGIATQVSSAVYRFVSNFQTAFHPQIVKLYASNDRKNFMNLIFQSSKFSYYLLLILALPVLINIDYILEIWLCNVPAHTVSFCRLIILYLLIDVISAPLWISVQATGEIRNYQIMMGILIILNLPLAYIFLKLGFLPESVLLARIIIDLLSLLARILYTRSKIGLPVRLYLREVILIIFLVTLLALPFPLLVSYHMSNFSGLVVTSIISLISTGLCIYLIGLKKEEKMFLKRLIRSNIKKLSSYKKILWTRGVS
ncbi:MAG: hypothetical protein KAS17_10080 [Victivallaceae bacterium]|nr:hypothetical protein [Victivallaceae bacterium]